MSAVRAMQVLSDDPEEVAHERDEVAALLRMAESLRHHHEAKFVELLSVLDSSDVIRHDDDKLLIFTEHQDTLDKLAERLSNKGYRVITIHGSMDVEARKQAQREFRTRAKIMIATDAAGEGINGVSKVRKTPNSSRTRSCAGSDRDDVKYQQCATDAAYTHIL